MVKLLVLSVGRSRGPLAEAIAEYERRAKYYFAFESDHVREEPYRGGREERVRDAEGERLLARAPEGYRVVALHREGDRWSSEEVAEFLTKCAGESVPGLVFLIGGAYGLSHEALRRAARLFSLSDLTLPHDMARLVLSEQLYRAGTIQRGEPYHKGSERPRAVGGR